MNSKPMLFECMECRETYLADNLCDGYNCPKCNGHVVARGYIKEIEEGIKVTRDKINRAKENGLIRKYTKPQCMYKDSIKIKDVKVERMKEELRYLVTYNRAFDHQHKIIIDSDRHLSDGEIKEMLHQNCTVCEPKSTDSKDSTVFTIHVNIDEVTNIDEVVRRFDKFLKTGMVDVIE